MKKRLLIASIAAMSILLAACGSNETKETSSNDNSGTVENHYIVDGKELTEDEYNQYLADNENESSNDSDAVETYIVNGKEVSEEEYNKVKDMTDDEYTQYLADKEKETESNENILDINVGDTFTLSDGTNELEITFNGVDFEQEVHSTSDNMYQQYFADKEGESYIVMKLDIKNVGGDSISDKVFTGYNSDKREYGKIQLTFNDKYNYQMQQLDTESMVMSKYWTIAPLKSQAIYFLQSVPDELVETPYTITFSLVDDETICRYTKE